MEADTVNAVEIEPDAATAGVAFLELRRRCCKWPIGRDDGPTLFRFCGDPAPEGSPYCRAHRTIAYLPPPEKKTRPR